MVKAIAGYPFMLQLVGFRAWIESGNDKIIDKKDMSNAISIAKKDFETRILKITLDDILNMGIMFLKAMMEDADYSTLDDISKRMGKSKSYTTNYRNRPSEYRVIEDVGHGRYRYALPWMREYLRDYSIHKFR